MRSNAAAAELPKGFALAWTGLSVQERISGGQAPLLLGLSILVVFLCLAALYESWAVPFSVLLVSATGDGRRGQAARSITGFAHRLH